MSAAEMKWTTNATDMKKPVVGKIVLRKISAVSQGDFDRVVFEFEGNSLPSYSVKYEDDPGSFYESDGELIEVAGNAFLHIGFRNTTAYYGSEWHEIATLEGLLNFPNLQEVVLSAASDGYAAYVLGLGSSSLYRVLELSDPTRLVVDIKH